MLSDSREWSPTGAMVDAVAVRLTKMFGLVGCWFEPFPYDVQLPRIEPGRIVLPRAEPGILPWSCDTGVELPIRFAGLTLGRFVLVPSAPTTGVAFSPRGRSEAIAMGERVGELIAAAMVADGTPRSEREADLG